MLLLDSLRGRRSRYEVHGEQLIILKFRSKFWLFSIQDFEAKFVFEYIKCYFWLGFKVM